MNLFFWNLNKKDLIETLPALSRKYDADVIILAESPFSDTATLRALNDNQERKFLLPPNFSSRLNIYTRFDLDSVIPLSDSTGIAIRHIRPPLGVDIILVAVHLPSKLYLNPSDHSFISVRLSQAINEAELRIGHERTIVIGDFNMNPFEDGLVSADGLHAVMDRNIALKGQRIVQGETRKYFYNPMWSLLGDLSNGPPGTYHYSSSGQVCFFWNAFDQVLLRPSLLEYFSDNSLEVITGFNDTNLLSATGKPDKTNFSDHLPICINLNTEEA